MAYLCATTHGLLEETEALKAVLDKSEISLPQPDPNAVLLQPPCPINKCDENWPLLVVSKGFFDGAMGSKKMALAAEVSDNLAEGKYVQNTECLNKQSIVINLFLQVYYLVEAILTVESQLKSKEVQFVLK